MNAEADRIKAVVKAAKGAAKANKKAFGTAAAAAPDMGPHQASPPAMKKRKWPVVVGVAAAFIVLFAIVGWGDEEPEVAAASPQEQVSTQPAEKPAEKKLSPVEQLKADLEKETGFDGSP